MAEGIANKEQAEKCLTIARDALAAGNLEKATRFGEKSMKLYPHDEVWAQVTPAASNNKCCGSIGTTSQVVSRLCGHAQGDGPR